MQRISVMLAATALGLSLYAAPAFAVDYIVGEPWCTPEAVNFVEERGGDRYHWCLAEKPAPFQQGIYSADVTFTSPTTLPGKPADPDPVDPEKPEVPSVPATPIEPAQIAPGVYKIDLTGSQWEGFPAGNYENIWAGPGQIDGHDWGGGYIDARVFPDGTALVKPR